MLANINLPTEGEPAQGTVKVTGTAEHTLPNLVSSCTKENVKAAKLAEIRASLKMPTDTRSAAKEVMERRLRLSSRLRSDAASSFSALNVDFRKLRPGSSPLAELDAGFLRVVHKTAPIEAVKEEPSTEGQAAPVAAQKENETMKLWHDRQESDSSQATTVPADMSTEEADSEDCSSRPGSPALEGETSPAEVSPNAALVIEDKPLAEMSFMDARTKMLKFRSQAEPIQPFLIAAYPAAIRLMRSAKAAPVSAPSMQSPLSESSRIRGAGNRRGGRQTFARSVSDRVSDREEPQQPSLPSPSMTAYRPRGNAGDDCQSELKRTIQSLLNKVCPENVATIAERIAAVQVLSVEDLEILIELIFKKAVTEPHYCETYADLVFALKSSFPEFPNPEGGKPLTFKGSVLNICQSEFEEVLNSIEPTDVETAKYSAEDLELIKKKRKDRMRANMKFIGHLFLRQLLSVKVIAAVEFELVHFHEAEKLPTEHALECAIELLTAIGYTLEGMPAGSTAVQQVCKRLLDLKNKKDKESKGAYCKRIQFMIQDLLDIREAGWAKKVFKSSAKTKEEIRLEHQRELCERAQGKDTTAAQHVVTGQRPLYLTSITGA